MMQKYGNLLTALENAKIEYYLSAQLNPHMQYDLKRHIDIYKTYRETVETRKIL